MCHVPYFWRQIFVGAMQIIETALSPFSISFLNQAKLDWLKWFLKVHLRLFSGHKITPNLLESVSVYQMIIITPYAKLVQCYLACRSCRYVCSTIV